METKAHFWLQSLWWWWWCRCFFLNLYEVMTLHSGIKECKYNSVHYIVYSPLIGCELSVHDTFFNLTSVFPPFYRHLSALFFGSVSFYVCIKDFRESLILRRPIGYVSLCVLTIRCSVILLVWSFPFSFPSFQSSINLLYFTYASYIFTPHSV
jgi:hypothetical protein